MLMTVANAFGNVPDQNTISPQDAIFSLCDTMSLKIQSVLL